MKKILFLIIILLLIFGCTQESAVPSSDTKTDLNAEFIQDANKLNSIDVNFYITAHARKDVNFCELISDSFTKSRCFFEFAVDLNNHDFCAKIDFPSVRIGCEIFFLDSNN